MESAAILASIIAGLAAAFYFLRPKVMERSTGAADSADRIFAENVASFERLADLSLDLRVACFPGDVLASFDAIVDKLMVVLPKMRAVYPADELTYVVKRMADDYLTDLVTPYMRMSAEAREKNREEMVALLNGFDVELAKIVEMLDAQQVSQFHAQAAFLKRKLFGESVEVDSQ